MRGRSKGGTSPPKDTKPGTATKTSNSQEATGRQKSRLVEAPQPRPERRKTKQVGEKVQKHTHGMTERVGELGPPVHTPKGAAKTPQPEQAKEEWAKLGEVGSRQKKRVRVPLTPESKAPREGGSISIHGRGRATGLIRSILTMSGIGMTLGPEPTPIVTLGAEVKDLATNSF